jgi:putative ABC transport system substrate-binding protein
MRRRAVIAAIGAAAAWRLGSSARAAGKPWRVGLLEYSRREEERVRLWDVFRRRLGELGYVEGEAIVFEQRWAEGRAARLPALAAELAAWPADAIVTTGTPSAQAALSATSTIPIVTATATDPVGAGLSASLARPSRNLTGVVTQTSDVAPKRVELLRELLPKATGIASLVDANNPASERSGRDTEAATQSLGIALHVVRVRGPDEIEGAFRSILQQRADALVVEASSMFFGERTRIGDLALKYRIPALGAEIAYADAGCLATYGSDYARGFRRAAEYVDKLLKGAKPADLPIEQPTEFQLVVNLKTAKALGLTIPQSILARADEVIE